MSVQILAYISNDTKEKMEAYSKAYGIKENYLVENALNYYLQALNEIPEEFIISTKISITKDSYESVIDLLKKPQQPTKELKELMSEDWN